MSILEYLITAPPRRGPYDSLAAVFAMNAALPFEDSVERALAGGFHADRLGYAFVAGYGAALARLTASVGGLQPPLAARASLCATESGGVQPRAIATTLTAQGEHFVLNGEKSFATLATAAEELLVVASTGVGEEGRNRLRIVRVRTDATGVSMAPRPETAFTPEIPHARVQFKDVRVSRNEVMDGDGYTNFLKPFRTVEDLHVLAATIGYLAGAARTHGFSGAVLAECVALAQILLPLAKRDPSDPLAHVVMAGAFASSRRLMRSLDAEWARAPEEERQRWLRDQPILQVAETARVQRTQAAYSKLGLPVQA